jgi:hypothetical protein
LDGVVGGSPPTGRTRFGFASEGDLIFAFGGRTNGGAPSSSFSLFLWGRGDILVEPHKQITSMTIDINIAIQFKLHTKYTSCSLVTFKDSDNILGLKMY